MNGANTFNGDVPQPNFNGNEKYSTTRLYADTNGVENGYSVPLKPEGPRSSVTLEWKNVSYAVKQRKEKKTLVKSMYGKALPGTMTAIMGPSGAGKTTLMNVLSGHYEKGYEGEVQVNGWIRDTELFNRQSCYVMQDDCLLPELTVRESLDMSIRLRMPSLQPAKRAHFWPGFKLSSSLRFRDEKPRFSWTHDYMLYSQSECKAVLLLRHVVYDIKWKLHI